MLMNDAEDKAAFSVPERFFEQLAVSLFVLTTHWKIIYANKPALALTGYTHKELVQSGPELLSGFFTTKEFSATCQHLLQDREQQETVSSVINHKDGSQLACQLYFSLLQENKEPYFLLSIAETKKAEPALEEKELFYQTIIETTQEGIWQIDAEHRTIFVNDYLPALLGYTKEEMLGKPFLDFMTDKAKREARALVEERRKGMAKQNEFTLLRKDGSPVHTLLQSSPIFGNGRYAGAVATVLDNTERKKAEERLVESERRFKALFENSEDGIALLSGEGTIVDVSPPIEKILGLTKEELIGTNTFDFIFPEDVPIIYDTIKDIRKEPLRRKTVEYRVLTKNGMLKWLESTFSNLLDEPAIRTVLINFRDITERKHAENRIIESEAKYRKAQAQGKLGYWEWDPLTGQLTWSDEIFTMFGLNPDSHIPDYEKFLGCVHPEDRTMVETIINQALANGSNYEVTYRIVLEDKSVRCVFMLADLVKNSSGELVKVVGMVQDVTAQKKIEQELSISEQNYRLLFEKSPVPFWMVNYPSFDFVEVNQAAIDLYGFSREDFLTMNVRDIRLDNDEAYFRNANTARISGLQQSLALHKKKNGDIIVVQLTTDRIVYNGNPVWLASARDITQEMLYEKQLEEKEQQLSLIFNSTINGMVLFEVNEEGLRFAAVNDALCAAIRIERKDVLGQLLSQVFSPEEIEHLVPGYQKAITTGTVQSFTATSRKRIGHRIVEYTAIPIKNGLGEVVQLLAVSNDVTEKKKAEDDLLKKNVELRQLSSHLENIREEERTKMAREIHDELGQQLTGLKMELSWINRKLPAQDEPVRLKLKSSLDLVDKTIDTVRRIATTLRPSLLDDLGLAEALHWQATEFSKHTGIPVTFHSNAEEIKFPPALSIAFFRVFQEALTNIARHAQATKVSCDLEEKEGWLQLTVADNGTGFLIPPETERKTLGLLGMQERLEMLNGFFILESLPGQGTTVLAKIPLG